ncbi:MAG: PQQ-binding-like beta-propeller repeat protein [Gammaproteobacteria bacterium]|nr:PQQ-binding-like beta-propeller repeat protein [Gammaproteobacteria bacterium]
MLRKALRFLGLFAISAASYAANNFIPITDAMLENPDQDDWLMISRTYDSQRYSPLDDINKVTVPSLTTAWELTLPTGTTETIPLVYAGIMYVIIPGGRVQALDATNGNLIWEYKRGDDNFAARAKGLAIYQDMIYYTAPDSVVVAIDAQTGEERWSAKTDSRGHTSAPLIVNGKVISGGACFSSRDNCYLAAHDARTGNELWRFYTTPEPGQPGDASWHGAALENRLASTWGLPGSFDPDTNRIYWGIANPMPDLRLDRHGDAEATDIAAPADLYSNSTVALNPDTGELDWYYQHLPGDDSDLDHAHERTLVTTMLAPDPAQVKWINPAITNGETRELSVMISEGGTVFVNDRHSGEFLWATPFPNDVEGMLLEDIDVNTGRTYLNWDMVDKTGNTSRIVCYWNTRSYWPTSYHPGTNSLFTSWIEACRELDGRNWRVVPRPGSDENKLTGLASINLSTGAITTFAVGRAPAYGAMLTTAGDLVFHGDMSKSFHAYDVETGELLWESELPGYISMSTITYAVNGKQYVAVMTGDNLKTPELLTLAPELGPSPRHTGITVFALPK